MRQGLLEPDFYGDLVYKLKKIVGSNNFQRSLLKKNPITRGIWKVLSIVFYLSNRFTNPSMYDIILTNYLSSM